MFAYAVSLFGSRRKTFRLKTLASYSFGLFQDFRIPWNVVAARASERLTPVFVLFAFSPTGLLDPTVSERSTNSDRW